MGKNKTNPNKILLTQADLNKAQKKWEEMLEQMKTEATSNATLLTQCVMMLALKNRFGFISDDIAEVLEETEHIFSKIGDMSTDYQLANVKKELEEINIFITEDWK